jgi:hypothetical protein
VCKYASFSSKVRIKLSYVRLQKSANSVGSPGCIQYGNFAVQVKWKVVNGKSVTELPLAFGEKIGDALLRVLALYATNRCACFRKAVLVNGCIETVIQEQFHFSDR